MKTSPLIELREISFTYPTAEAPVLTEINLILAQGQRLGLMGPNGCGKTTFFHVIMGLLTPQLGEIRYKGLVLKNEADFRGFRREVGLLFQDADDQLFSPTVIEDVAFGPLNLGLDPQKAGEMARSTLKRLGLLHLEERITHHLSGGEKKLVSLATILAMEPKVLLLDEPTNNLDPKTRTKLISIIKELELSFIIISHDWDFLAATSDTIHAMAKGRIDPARATHPHSHHHAHPHGGHPHQHGDS